jgi:hypothetical protein
LTPSQALLMLYGLPPPTTKETYKEMKRIFVDKEKMLEVKYIKILEEITIKYYKGYEHEKIKEVSGTELDRLLKNTEDYLNRLKELREQIEKKTHEKTSEQMYHDVFELLRSTTNKNGEKAIIEEFENNYVKKGKFTDQDLKAVQKVIEVKKEAKKGKISLLKADQARKSASGLINSLIEYNQRCELVSFERGKMMLKYNKGQIAELINANGKSFLVEGSIIKELGDKMQMSNMEELSKALNTQKDQKNITINPKVFELLKKELGDYEVLV